MRPTVDLRQESMLVRAREKESVRRAGDVVKNETLIIGVYSWLMREALTISAQVFALSIWLKISPGIWKRPSRFSS